MSKDQNPSDKACDAYFDNPYAATSGSYYSERVTFYAGFAAGAASRDADVVSLTNQRDYEYVRAENAEQERDQLREKVKVLQSGVLAVNCLIADSYGVAGLHMNGDIAEWNSLRIGGQFESWLIEFDEALAATEPR